MAKDSDFINIKIPKSSVLGNSKSGKTLMVANTGGNVEIPGGYKVNLKVFRKHTSDEQARLGSEPGDGAQGGYEISS